MRKPKDYDAELKALDERAKELKERKLRQFGVLVVATGADTLPVEELVGALLLAAERKGAPSEECRQRGERFFRRPVRGAAKRGDRGASSGAADTGRTQPAGGEAGAV
ncbi:conjugal transfer protein TraD [Pelagerythrobacter aerophilus]